MTREEVEIEERINTLLIGLRDVSARDPQVASHGLAAFLSQAESISIEMQSSNNTESTRQINRLIGWIYPIQTIIHRKERKTMMTTLVSFLITLTLIIGGTGATVFAAQSSLPDDPLYQIKMLSEELRLQLSIQDRNQLRLALEFANQRVEEIVNLNTKGRSISTEVADRLGQQVEFALQVAAGMEPFAMHQALEQINASLRQQQQTMSQLEATQPENPIIAQIRLRLREQLRLVEMGLTDPQVFQEQVRLRQQTRQEFQQGAPEESPAPGNGDSDPGQNQPAIEPVQNGNSFGTGPQISPGSGSDIQTTPEPGNNPVSTPNAPFPPGMGGSDGSGSNQPSQPDAPGNGGSGSDGSGSNQPSQPDAPGNGGSGSGGSGQSQPSQSNGPSQSSYSSSSGYGGSGGRP